MPRQDALSGVIYIKLQDLENIKGVLPYKPIIPSCQGWIAVAAKRWARAGPQARLPTVPNVPLPGPRNTDCSARRPPSASQGLTSVPSDLTSAPMATVWTQQRVIAATVKKALR